MSETTFLVADIIQKLADEEGINLEVDNVDDSCYGMVLTSEKSFVDFLAQHRIPFNYQVVDGNPIRVVRRAINDDFVIDYKINEDDCIARDNSPAIQFRRIDLATLPRQVEVQYYDVNRGFATTNQVARHPGAPTTNTVSTFPLDFTLDADTARQMAFDILYRLWAQQVALTFEHRDLTIEPGDTVQITADAGVFTVLVQESTLTSAHTNQISGTVLLTESGISISGGTADAYVEPNIAIETAAWLVTLG